MSRRSLLLHKIAVLRQVVHELARTWGSAKGWGLGFAKANPKVTRDGEKA